MPELPDLTVFAENLSKAVVGKQIARAEYRGAKRLNVAPEELAGSLLSAQIAKVQRVGKEIWFSFSTGDSLSVHLMLTGGFVLTNEKQAKGLDYQVLTLCFSDGSALAVTDPKGWVMVALNPKHAEAPDALSITADYLKSVFRKKPKMLIKAFLLDQKLIGGIGNAYADEILWAARISPKSAVGKLPPEVVDALVESIPAVLQDGIAQIGKRRPGIIAGEVREFMKVHNPSLKRSPTGAPVIKEQIASKTTYYTEEQTLYQ